MTRLFSLFLSDQKIIELLRSGNERVLNMLYDRYLRMITRYVCDNSGTDSDAEEVLQDALIILWENVQRKDFELKSRLSTYLYAVAKNKWLQELNRRKRLTTLDSVSSNPGNEVPVDEQLLEEETVEIIKRCIEQLQPLCQSVLIAYYYEGKTMQEICEITGLANENVAKSKKYQCKKELERLVKMEMKDPQEVSHG